MGYVNHRRMKFCFKSVHCKTKTKLAISLACTILFIETTFMYTWLHFLEKEENLYFPKSLITKEILNNSLGKILKIRHPEPMRESAFTFNVTWSAEDVEFPKVFHYNTTSYSSRPRKYAFVIGRYWEQMTQSMRAFLALVLQASSVGRSVVAPKVKDSRFQTSGFSLGYYFDMKFINGVLNTIGYPSIIENEEFLKHCSPKDPNYTTVHFLYDQEKAAVFTKNKFRLDDETYSNMALRARKTGWTRCSFIQKLTKQVPQSKMYCVDSTVVTDWVVFEQKIIKSAECLSIVLWRGTGDTFRARFEENHLKLNSRDFFHALNPSSDVLAEVENFQNRFLGSRYIGVQFRGEHVAIFHGLTALRQCVRLLGHVVNLVKELFHIDNVFIATDTATFGSASWKDSVKRDMITDDILLELQNLVLTVTNGITFEQTADEGQSLDRGFVALVEMTLVSQAQSLLTVGFGSFQDWAMNRFLDFHRDDLKANWSIVRLCFD